MAACCHNNNNHNHNKTKQNLKKSLKAKTSLCVYFCHRWTTFALVSSSAIATLLNAKWWNSRFTFELVQQQYFVKMTWKFCHRRIKFHGEEWVDVYKCSLRYKDSLPDVHLLNVLLCTTNTTTSTTNTSLNLQFWNKRKHWPLFPCPSVWIIIFKEFSQSSLAPCISPLKAL